MLGWWIPVVPTALTLLGAGTITAFFDRGLRFELEQRRRAIERTYEAIHNGPLQQLAVILRSLGRENLSTEQLQQNLQFLNEELRSIYEYMRQEALISDKLYLQGNLVLDLQFPIDELLYQVYDHTLEAQIPGFATIKTYIPPNFEPLKVERFSIDQKRGLCLFLQEALVNVGKHAISATRLQVVFTSASGYYYFRVLDNAPNTAITGREGQGTRQANAIAAELGGYFRRVSNNPQGTINELIFPMKRRWLMRILGIIRRFLS